MKSLLLFTGSYPFSTAAEYSFIPQEIAELALRFKQILLIPKVITGTKVDILENNVSLNTDYASFIASKINKFKFLLLTILDGLLVKELTTQPLFFLKNIACVKRTLYYRLVSVMTEMWIKKYLSSSGLLIGDYVFETWWFDDTTLGLANFSYKSKKTLTITRVHGYDLYEERHNPQYIPFRRFALQRVNGVFAASQDGANYLLGKYPGMERKIFVGLLGVHDPGFSNIASTDGIFRILSCSYLVDLKRISLLILGLHQLGKKFRGKRFHWTHIGSGPEKERLMVLAREMITDNVQFDFTGYLSKKDIYQFYSIHSVDLFINVSSTEGGNPVSIMEAISCGIPILATSVGGNKEIVNHENGLLLSENPSPEEIALAIGDLMSNEDKLLSLRKGSKKRWFEHYNAEKNYDQFADVILNSNL